MKKNKNGNNIFVYIILFIIFIFLSVIIYNLVEENKKKTITSSDENNNMELDEDITSAGVRPFEEDQIIKVVINNIEYDVLLENNIASYDLLSILPLELDMNDLNNNEKYSYLSFSLTSDDDYTGKISKGDVMLYQSNCIVIFYKDFDTTYKYTKIGHIENLPDLNNESIKVIFK